MKYIPAMVLGEPYLSPCNAWLKTYDLQYKKITEYVESIGGEKFYCFLGHKGFSVRFALEKDNLRRKSPKDWTAPDRRRELSHPKKKTEAYETVMSFEPLPSTYALYKGIPLQLTYKNADNTISGGTRLVRGLDPELTYFKLNGVTRFYLFIPDYESIMKEHKDEKTFTFNKEVTDFVWPDGLLKLTEAEFKLHEAISDVEAERGKPVTRDLSEMLRITVGGK